MEAPIKAPYIPENYEYPTYLLEAVYKSLRLHDDIVKIYIPLSDSFYISALLKSNGYELTPYEVEHSLYKEGILHGDYYGIPEWYWRKWMAKNFHKASKHTRRWIVQEAQSKMDKKVKNDITNLDKLQHKKFYFMHEKE